eukprot:12852152-Heterocapsa_arctica.AAC.1
MVSFSFEWASQLPHDQRPIPKFVFDLESFPRKHAAMCSAASLDSLSPLSRWATHKLILREVARIVLDEHLTLHGQSGDGRGLTISSICRAI